LTPPANAAAVVSDVDDGGSGEPVRHGFEINLALTRGSAWARLEPQSDPRSMFAFDLPTARISSRGGTFRIQVGGDQSATVAVTSGVAEVDAQSQTVMVAAGQTTTIASGSPAAAISETPAPARALRITLGTRDDMYVCDGIGRCAGMLPVLGVPVAI